MSTPNLTPTPPAGGQGINTNEVLKQIRAKLPLAIQGKFDLMVKPGAPLNDLLKEATKFIQNEYPSPNDDQKKIAEDVQKIIQDTKKRMEDQEKEANAKKEAEAKLKEEEKKVKAEAEAKAAAALEAQLEAQRVADARLEVAKGEKGKTAEELEKATKENSEADAELKKATEEKEKAGADVKNAENDLRIAEATIKTTGEGLEKATKEKEAVKLQLDSATIEMNKAKEAKEKLENELEQRIKLGPPQPGSGEKSEEDLKKQVEDSKKAHEEKTKAKVVAEASLKEREDKEKGLRDQLNTANQTKTVAEARVKTTQDVKLQADNREKVAIQKQKVTSENLNRATTADKTAGVKLNTARVNAGLKPEGPTTLAAKSVKTLVAEFEARNKPKDEALKSPSAGGKPKGTATPTPAAPSLSIPSTGDKNKDKMVVAPASLSVPMAPPITSLTAKKPKPAPDEDTELKSKNEEPKPEKKDDDAEKDPHEELSWKKLFKQAFSGLPGLTAAVGFAAKAFVISPLKAMAKAVISPVKTYNRIKENGLGKTIKDSIQKDYEGSSLKTLVDGPVKNAEKKQENLIKKVDSIANTLSGGANKLSEGLTSVKNNFKKMMGSKPPDPKNTELFSPAAKGDKSKARSLLGLAPEKKPKPGSKPKDLKKPKSNISKPKPNINP